MERIKRFPFTLLALILSGLVATGCTSPALHVIGVYEGQAPPGVDDRAWLARCNEDNTDKQPGTAPAGSSIECQQMDANLRAMREVVVHVSDDTRPVVLALTAYNSTLWRVSLTPGVKLTKVILAGYHSQSISGIPPETPVEIYTHDPSPCETCWQSARYFYSYQTPPMQLKGITGLEVTSFQGRYNGAEFAISPGTRKIEEPGPRNRGRY